MAGLDPVKYRETKHGFIIIRWAQDGFETKYPIEIGPGDSYVLISRPDVKLPHAPETVSGRFLFITCSTDRPGDAWPLGVQKSTLARFLMYVHCTYVSGYIVFLGSA